MSDLKDRARDLAIGTATGAATTIAAKGFQRWMDRYDQKPVFRAQLVRRFRRFFGLHTSAEREDNYQAISREVKEYLDEKLDHIENTPAETPRAKKEK